jgi:hypothetical protein
MIVISDNGPLICADLLPRLFGNICCPAAIIRE